MNFVSLKEEVQVGQTALRFSKTSVPPAATGMMCWISKIADGEPQASQRPEARSRTRSLGTCELLPASSAVIFVCGNRFDIVGSLIQEHPAVVPQPIPCSAQPRELELG